MFLVLDLWTSKSEASGRCPYTFHVLMQVAASIVVILDNHFNPSVSSQCISRAHRYGQTKRVRVFRLAIEGSMEAKVYARSVNKTGVSMRVIDGFFTEGMFSAHELANLLKSDIIVTCDDCGKRRRLLGEQLPPGENEKWCCKMNDDKQHNRCDTAEEKLLQRAKTGVALPDDYENDTFLQHLRGVINKTTRKTEIVTSCFPVEVSNDTDICCDHAIAKLKQEIKEKQEESQSKPVKKRPDNQATKAKVLHQFAGQIAQQEHATGKSDNNENDDDKVEIVEVRPSSKRKFGSTDLE